MPSWMLCGLRWGALLAALAVVGSASVSAEAGLTRLEIPETDTYADLYVPHSATPGAQLPLVVFLHGSGSLPEAWEPTLEPLAESLGFVLLMPASIDPNGFGVGADNLTVARALDLAAEHVPIAPQRVSIAGHSAGGAYAVVLAYSGEVRLSGVFSLAAPYRTVLALGDPDYTAPLYAYYGKLDPNYQSGSGIVLVKQLERLGVPATTQYSSGYGHSSWPDGTLEDGFQFLLAQRYATAGGCVPSDTRLCLRDGRFVATVGWSDGSGGSGVGRVATARTPESGLFSFFSPDNWELQLKVLDGCSTNGHYWVLGAASTNVAYTITVRDRKSGATWRRSNPLGRLSPAIADVNAFATCP